MSNPRPTSLRVAAIQYDLTGGLTFTQFMEKIRNYTRVAKQQGAELVVFPELFSADLFPGGRVRAVGEARVELTVDDECRAIGMIAREYTQRFFHEVAELSRELGVSIQAGTIPRIDGDEVRNTAMLAFPDRPPAFQDKLFLTACERKDWGWSPGRELKLIDAPWGSTLISICYDTEVPWISNQMAARSPEVILVPSCTCASDGFYRVRWTAQARAVEHHAYVVHTGTVGPGTLTPNMNTHYGQAAILTPSDAGFERVLAQGAANEPAVVVADLDLSRLRKSRETTNVWPARDQSERRAMPVVSA